MLGPPAEGVAVVQHCSRRRRRGRDVPSATCDGRPGVIVITYHGAVDQHRDRHEHAPERHDHRLHEHPRGRVPVPVDGAAHADPVVLTGQGRRSDLAPIAIAPIPTNHRFVAARDEPNDPHRAQPLGRPVPVVLTHPVSGHPASGGPFGLVAVSTGSGRTCTARPERCRDNRPARRSTASASPRGHRDGVERPSRRAASEARRRRAGSPRCC